MVQDYYNWRLEIPKWKSELRITPGAVLISLLIVWALIFVLDTENFLALAGCTTLAMIVIIPITILITLYFVGDNPTLTWKRFKISTLKALRIIRVYLDENDIEYNIYSHDNYIIEGTNKPLKKYYKNEKYSNIIEMNNGKYYIIIQKSFDKESNDASYINLGPVIEKGDNPFIEQLKFDLDKVLMKENYL
ncbi:hypothetical protein [[Eubacterium] cellulosolvens]